MSPWTWVSIGVGAALVLGVAVASGFFLVLGRRQDARALAGFVPDCLVLFSRLLRDPRVPRRRKVLIAALIAYLASPIDLWPGSAVDDAILAALVLRTVLRDRRPLLEQHWPGPRSSLDVVLRLAGLREQPARLL